MAQQNLDFLALAAAAAVVADGAVLGEAAGALDKGELVIAPPGDDIVLADAVHRAYQLHALEVLRVQLRHHALQLGAVKHRHHGGLDHIV